MKTKFLPGMPLIPSGLTPYSITPVHRVEFPDLSPESRNKFQNPKRKEKVTNHPEKESLEEHLGKNVDVTV